MFSNKKGKIMRHPYATLTVIGLATVGALSISHRVKSFFSCKMGHLSNMVSGMKKDIQEMN